jgi:hypothetical protein
VAGFYLGVGILLLLGGRAAADLLDDGVGDAPAVAVVQLALGLALLVASFRIGPGTGERLARWRDRAVGSEGSTRAVVALALLAATVEVATMLPYLGAIGLLAGSDGGSGARVGVLAAYCLVMVLPALLLLGVRIALRHRVEAVLERLSQWVERIGAEATAWVLGIAGFLVARDAVARLFL